MSWIALCRVWLVSWRIALDELTLGKVALHRLSRVWLTRLAGIGLTRMSGGKLSNLILTRIGLTRLTWTSRWWLGCCSFSRERFTLTLQCECWVFWG